MSRNCSASSMRCASTTSAPSPTATRKTPRPSAWPTTCPAADKNRRQRLVMARQKRIVAARQKARVGERARLLVDGPSRDHDWVMTGRLAGQAPEIDPQVYLTDCGPDEAARGQFLDVEIVGARGYDLIARPVGAD